MKKVVHVKNNSLGVSPFSSLHQKKNIDQILLYTDQNSTILESLFSFCVASQMSFYNVCCLFQGEFLIFMVEFCIFLTILDLMTHHLF